MDIDGIALVVIVRGSAIRSIEECGGVVLEAVPQHFIVGMVVGQSRVIGVCVKVVARMERVYPSGDGLQSVSPRAVGALLGGAGFSDCRARSRRLSSLV